MRRHALTVALAGLLIATGAQAATKHTHKSRAASKPAPAHTSAAASTPSPADQARMMALMQYQKDLVSVLALRGDAEHLLGAALLARPLPDQPQGLGYHDLITRAAKAPHAGPGVTWAQLADCDAQANACPNVDAFAELQKQVPGNAAVWMLAMDLAAIKKDDAGVRAALAKVAAAKTYDDYFGVELQGVAMSVGTLPPLPDTMAGAQQGDPTTALGVELLIAVGITNQQPRPSLQPVLQLCSADSAARDDALKGECLKAAHLLQWGSSPVGRAVGLHIQGELDPAAKAATDKQARNLAWQMQNYGALGIKAMNDDTIARPLLEAARGGGTELSLVLSTLRTNGIPTEAPAGWQLPQPQPAPTSSAAR
jgi:hypothetical protein